MISAGGAPRRIQFGECMGPTKRPEDATTLVRPAGFRPSQSLPRAITAWMALQEERPSLSQAIARLVELGLTHADQDRQKLRAREMAGDTIDRMGDAPTPAVVWVCC